MVILGIETSCDDTCIAIVKAAGKKRPIFEIMSNIVSSQVKIHEKYGGVYPTLAKREHEKNLPLVLKKVLSKAKNPKIDLIAVTVGPGLEPCLWTGVNFAKDLAKKLNLLLVPVNHIEAHILANWLSPVSKNPKRQTPNPKQTPNSNFQNSKRIRFPAVCLIVSGGNTQIISMKDFGKYKVLGETRDDAAGECFDKTARILGLAYPGGPAIEKQAKKSSRDRASVDLPRPMIYQKNYDFSFSGLKTAVLYDFKSRKPKEQKSKQYIQAIAKEIQQAIIDVLIKKTIKAAKKYKAKTIILGGGVTANKELRNQFKLEIGNWKLKINFLVPPKNLCTDNAAMTAVAGYFNRPKAKKGGQIKVDANLSL